ncbi:MAG: exonuclease SbcCD subunit D [Firmicutes bacterium]|nr:exonuclease SbcCD subunit D [Bacillota bacterium]
MRIFHVADLHFGKIVYGLSMLEDQRHWCDRLLRLCDEEKPDAVLIAGDIYDRAAPGGDAVELLDYLLTALAERGIQVLMVAGNHDSGQRLAFARTMLAAQNVHIAGSIDPKTGRIEQVYLEDPDGFGPIRFWLMPYTYPEQIRLALGEGSEENCRTYGEAVSALLSAQDIDINERNVILAHQNVTVDGREIERGGSETMVGGVGQIDFHVFDPFDYVALGHIHSGYPVGRPEVRYAGTPIHYHFDEIRRQDKGIVEVVLTAKGQPARIRTLPIRPLHAMRLIEGKRQEVYDLLEADEGRDEYVGITLTDERVTPETAGYLRGILQLRGSRLLQLQSTFAEFAGKGAFAAAEAVREKAVEDLFADFYEEQTGGDLPDEDEYELLKFAAELIRRREEDQPLQQEEIDQLLEHAGIRGGEDK